MQSTPSWKRGFVISCPKFRSYQTGLWCQVSSSLTRQSSMLACRKKIGPSTSETATRGMMWDCSYWPRLAGVLTASVLRHSTWIRHCPRSAAKDHGLSWVPWRLWNGLGKNPRATRRNKLSWTGQPCWRWRWPRSFYNITASPAPTSGTQKEPHPAKDGFSDGTQPRLPLYSSGNLLCSTDASKSCKPFRGAKQTGDRIRRRYA